jgi:hypothetical protein
VGLAVAVQGQDLARQPTLLLVRQILVVAVEGRQILPLQLQVQAAPVS